MNLRTRASRKVDANAMPNSPSVSKRTVKGRPSNTRRRVVDTAAFQTSTCSTRTRSNRNSTAAVQRDVVIQPTVLIRGDTTSSSNEDSPYQQPATATKRRAVSRVGDPKQCGSRNRLRCSSGTAGSTLVKSPVSAIMTSSSPKTPLRKNRVRGTTRHSVIADANTADVVMRTPTRTHLSSGVKQNPPILQRTPITNSCLQMQLTAAPKVLPCREQETRRVVETLQAAIVSGSGGGCLYISGMPGTGKTATVLAAIARLKRSAKLPSFQVVEVNAMRIPNPNSVYQIIYQSLFQTKAPSAQRSYVALDKYFRSVSSRRPVCILLVDEIDGLVTKKQNVLYTLFDWPTLKESKLVVVAIANTMDLPERMIPRCASRLGFGRLDFFPYSKDQIVKIITSRLTSGTVETDLDVEDDLQFEPKAVEMCARKVASLSGDIRRALQICRRALEIAYAKGEKSVEVEDVVSAAKDICHSSHHVGLQCLPHMHKLFITASLLEIENSPILCGAANLMKVCRRINGLISQCGMYPTNVQISMPRIKDIAIKLRDANLIGLIPDMPIRTCFATDSIVERSQNKRNVKMINSVFDDDGGNIGVTLIPELEEIKISLATKDDLFLLQKLQS